MISILIDISVYPEGPNRTSTLTEAHQPELLPDGGVRFRTPHDGLWHRINAYYVKRVTELAKPIEPALPLQKPLRGRPKS